jgi:hypothetical protein
VTIKAIWLWWTSDSYSEKVKKTRQQTDQTLGARKSKKNCRKLKKRTDALGWLRRAIIIALPTSLRRLGTRRHEPGVPPPGNHPVSMARRRLVLENGVVVGCIFKGQVASGHNGDIGRAAQGYKPTRETAMAAFSKSWRRS